MRRRRVETIAVCFLIMIMGSIPMSLAATEQPQSYPTIQPTGFVQVWARYDKTAGSNHGDDYRIARARFGVKGNVTPKIDYFFLSEWGSLTYVDPVTLLDAWVNFKMHDLVNIKIGQTWYKFSLNGTTGIPAIPFIYRPDVVDGIWLAMGRKGSYGYDKGIEFWGEKKNVRHPWGYFLSVTTGTGLLADTWEDNNDKDVTGRVWVELLKGLRVGASGFRGTSRMEISAVENRDLPEYAYGLEMSYTHKYFRVIGEYLHEVLEGHADGVPTKRPQGWYAMVGWKPLSWLEIPVQYAWFEKDGVRPDTGLETVTVGLTWYLKTGTLNNIKLNYLIRNAEANYGSNPRNMVACQVQIVY